MSKTVKEITQDLANAIVRGDTMVPACSVGTLLEYIETLELEIVNIEDRLWFSDLEKNFIDDL